MPETTTHTCLKLAQVPTPELAAELERREDEDAVAVVLRDIGRIAGVEFPRLVGEWRDLNRECAALRVRCAAAEWQRDLLVRIAACEMRGVDPDAEGADDGD